MGKYNLVILGTLPCELHSHFVAETIRENKPEFILYHSLFAEGSENDAMQTLAKVVPVGNVELPPQKTSIQIIDDFLEKDQGSEITPKNKFLFEVFKEMKESGSKIDGCDSPLLFGLHKKVCEFLLNNDNISSQSYKDIKEKYKPEGPLLRNTSESYSVFIDLASAVLSEQENYKDELVQTLVKIELNRQAFAYNRILDCSKKGSVLAIIPANYFKDMENIFRQDSLEIENDFNILPSPEEYFLDKKQLEKAQKTNKKFEKRKPMIAHSKS